MPFRPPVTAPRAHFHRIQRSKSVWSARRAAKQPRRRAVSSPAAGLDVRQSTSGRRAPAASWSRGVNAALITPVLRLGDGMLNLSLRGAGFAPVDVATAQGTVRLWDATGRNPEGPVVVVLHGLGGSATEMGSPLGAAQGYASRVIAVDSPSHGGSFALGEQTEELPPEEPPHACIERMVSAVNEALDAVIDGPVVLCGHSLGGYLAARYALEGAHGHSARLQLIEPDGAPWTDQEVADGRAAMDVRSGRSAGALAHKTFPSRPLRAALCTRFLWARFAAPEVRYLVHSDAFQPTLSPAQLAALPADTLLIRGQREAFNAPHTLDYFREHLPPGHLLSQPDTGHGDICVADAGIMEPLESHALGLLR